ncbi:MAG: DUF1211 domain-containing protein [Verrucomicrobia bacterium]|nr:DUF1211 domain-containing protein [Verrucomicrobiota bacterium]
MPSRRSEPTRLEGFSDAVFALSATLLVVSLEVPANFTELVNNLVGFGAFAISFAALILIWSIHNAFFRRYGLQDSVTVALNACLLFVVLYYVFPLKFLASGFMSNVLGIGRHLPGPSLQSLDELRVIFILYSAGFTLLFTIVTLLYRHALARAEQLQLNAAESSEALLLFRHYAIFSLTGVLSILVALAGLGISWGFPGIVYALLGPLCWVHADWHNRKYQA